MMDFLRSTVPTRGTLHYYAQAAHVESFLSMSVGLQLLVPHDDFPIYGVTFGGEFVAAFFLAPKTTLQFVVWLGGTKQSRLFVNDQLEFRRDAWLADPVMHSE